MMGNRLKAVLLALALVPGPASMAVADETGLASMHSWRREAGRTCFVDHWHYGNGEGATRKVAERSAIASWSSFTDLEYGSAWARYSRAASRSLKCSQGGPGWTCSVEARPCR